MPPRLQGRMLSPRAETCLQIRGCGRLLACEGCSPGDSIGPGVPPGDSIGPGMPLSPAQGTSHPPSTSCPTPSPQHLARAASALWLLQHPAASCPPRTRSPASGRNGRAQQHPNLRRQSTSGFPSRRNRPSCKPRVWKRKSDDPLRGQSRFTAFPPLGWGRREPPELPTPGEPGSALWRLRAYGALCSRA